ncbi:MAG: F0F1 ATP synthase subunit A [Acholeplasmataceae bacterium]|nr:F0F1 ATP synthase subunit A [Acholeplasmataceae bacterium]
MTQIINYLKNLPIYFLTSIGIMTAIAVFAVILGKKIGKMDAKSKPNKLETLVISGVGGFNGFVKAYVGKHWKYVTPFALTMALYVFISNISGLVALDSPTKYTAVTVSMSLMAFFVVQSTGIVSQGWRHFLGIFKPLPLMAPLNVVSDVVPIVSMALRLFGNIASGALLMTLIYRLTGWLSIVIAPPLHMVFDIGFGLIQTLVIVLLTIIFASMKCDEADFDI